MLLDCKENINYAYTVMSAAETGATPPQPEMNDKTPRKDITAAETAVTYVTRRALGAEADGPRKKLAEGEKPENLTPAERALDLYQSISTGKTATGDPYQWELFNITGNELILGPQHKRTITLPSGKEKTLPAFTNGEVAAAGVTTMDDKGNYGCFLRDTASGNFIFLDTEGNRVDVAVQPQKNDNGEIETHADAFRRTSAEQAEIGNIILELPVAIDEVADAQLLSEVDTIKAALPPEKAALFNQYVNTRPQNDPDETYELPDDIDSILQQVEASLPEKKPEAAADREKGVLDDLVNRQLARVTQEIQAIQNKKPEEITDADHVMLLKLTAEKDGLTLAQGAVGEVGIVLQHSILQGISEQHKRSGISTIAIDTTLAETQIQVDRAKSNYRTVLERQGIEPAQIDRIMAAINDPAQLEGVFSDSALTEQAGKALMSGFFGQEADKLDVLTMFDNIKDSGDAFLATLPPSLFDKIRGFATENKLKKMGILALILAAIPAVAGALAVGAGLQATGVMGGSRR